MNAHFTRSATSTHVVTYGTPAGELFTTYWPSETAAKREAASIRKMLRAERIRPHVTIQTVAEIDAIELEVWGEIWTPDGIVFADEIA